MAAVGLIKNGTVTAVVVVEGHTGAMDTPAKRRAELNPARVLGLAAVASGILAAAVNADAWWFLLGVIAFVFLFVAGEG